MDVKKAQERHRIRIIAEAVRDSRDEPATGGWRGWKDCGGAG
jgi:hypothetical protein